MTNTELIDEYARLRDEFKAKGIPMTAGRFPKWTIEPHQNKNNKW